MMSNPRLDLMEIVDTSLLDRVKTALAGSAVIVEVRFEGADGPPDRLIFNRFDLFADYLARVVRPGDGIVAWFDSVCNVDNALVSKPAHARQQRDAEAP